MPVPGFQSLMRPILAIASDEQLHRVGDLVPVLSDEFHLSDEEREALLPSGTQRLIVNRTYWAVTYLAKTHLLERIARGQVRIADRGRQALAQDEPIDVKYLRRYPELQAFLTPSAQKGEEPVSTPIDSHQTPEELLEGTFDALRHSVEADLLERVLASSPEFFEQLVVDLLHRMGYGGTHAEAARRVGHTGDDGIDGVIDEDRLGLDAVYIQAKRWDPSHPVRRPDLQAFAGSLEGQRANKGIYITTSRFTDDARDYVTRISRRIVLIDGAALTRLMYDHGIGVRDHRHYEVRRVDSAYFEGEV